MCGRIISVSAGENSGLWANHFVGESCCGWNHCKQSCLHQQASTEFKKRLGGKRGAGVPGYGVPGCGKHGVWWKTRGVENTGSGGKHGFKCKTQRNHYFVQQWSLNFVISNCNENQSAWNEFFCHKNYKSELNISWERKPFKCQLDMQWLLHGASVFIFRSDLRNANDCFA